MKRIVIVSPAHPYRGGQKMVESHLYSYLTNIGYDVHTVSFKMLYPKILFPGTTQIDASEKVFFSHDDKIYRIINSINPITWYMAYKKIKELNADLILIVWWMSFFAPCYTFISWFTKKFTKSKIGFVVENYISHENRWFDKALTKMCLNTADVFICQSNYIKNNLAKNHPNTPTHKTTLCIYDCYDFKEYTQETARKLLNIKTEKVVLFFGLIRKYKGLDKLIEAFKFISNKENTTLLIVGECYDDINDYKKLIEQEGISNKTILIDKFISNEDLEPYIKASTVTCLPYNNASQSGVLMVSYGFGKPVVVNNVGGLGELVVEGKTGYITPNNSPQEIAKGLNKVLEDNTSNFAENISNLNKNLGYKNIDNIIAEILA